MKKKTIVEKILGFFGVGVEKEQHKPEVKEVIAQTEQKIKRKEKSFSFIGVASDAKLQLLQNKD